MLPCDPGMLWRLGRHLGPRRAAHKLETEYDYIEAIAHINSIFNLGVLIRYYFSDHNLRETWCPGRLAIPALNLFYVCNIDR